jgi:hypothetical protein
MTITNGLPDLGTANPNLVQEVLRVHQVVHLKGILLWYTCIIEVFQRRKFYKIIITEDQGLEFKIFNLYADIL